MANRVGQTAPPERVLNHLRAHGKGHTQCAKSQRIAVLYDPMTNHVKGSGYNAPPAPFACDGSVECRRDCGKLCIHAEAMAITDALAHPSVSGVTLTGLELVHGKFVNGELVGGGGPSCWQCSKTILEHDLAGVWLLELPDRNLTGEQLDKITDAQWRFYTGLAFHHATLAHPDNKLYDNLRR